MNLTHFLRSVIATAVVLMLASLVLYFLIDLSVLPDRDRAILALTLGAAVGLRGGLPSFWSAGR